MKHLTIDGCADGVLTHVIKIGVQHLDCQVALPSQLTLDGGQKAGDTVLRCIGCPGRELTST